MCDPATILAAGTAAVSIGSTVASHSAQKKQAKAVEKSAADAMAEDLRSLTLRQTQEEDAGAQTILNTDRQARIAKGLTTVSAGEAGVSGVSVDALLGDIERQRAEADVIAGKNTQAAVQQIAQEKRGVRANAANRAASAPSPSGVQTGLAIAGAGLNLGSFLINNRPKPKS